MITELIHNINIFSKRIKIGHSIAYKKNTISYVPYKEIIVSNESYPNKLFLIHENIIYKNHSLHDTNYEVFSWNKNGNYIGEEDVKNLGKIFFRNMKVLKKL